jgi:type II secretory pathway component PulF
LVTIALSLVLLYSAAHIVLPRTVDMFESLHVHPSPLSLGLIQGVQVVTGPGLWVVLGISAAFVLLYRDVLRDGLLALLLRAPVTSALMGQVLAISFCDLVGRLYAQGLPLSTALELAGRSGGQRLHTLRLARMQAACMQGVPLSDALSQIEYFPRLVGEMTRIGEESGSLDRTFGMVVHILDQNTEHLLSRFTSLLEPVALVGTGLLVLGFLCALLLPLYQMLDVVQ